MIKKNIYKIILWIAGISFILNLVWENAQAPLYAGYLDFSQHFYICSKATLGDVIIFLLIYGLVSFMTGDWYCATNIDKRCVALTSIIGILIAIIIEQRAIQYGFWAYNSQMPLLPILGLGLFPILQMAILPITVFWFSGIMYKRTNSSVKVFTKIEQ